MNKKFGFTLAEVLITLAIIGVVAAITIPILIANYQKDQTATSLKKIYSEISQVILKSTNDNGSTKSWNWDSATFSDDYLIPYFSIAKDCGSSDYTSACVNSTKYYMRGDAFSPNTGRFIFLNNGVSIQIIEAGGGAPYLAFNVDLNGNKEPNIFGKDVFQMGIYTWYATKSYELIMRAANSGRSVVLSTGDGGCNINANTQSGLFCGTLIQRDGWKIADDYPW